MSHMVTQRPDMVDLIAALALRWADPDYSVREDAIERTLEAENHFTEAAIAFAINQQMALLTEDELRAWQTELNPSPPRGDAASPVMETVAVLNPGNIPFVELQDLVATLLAGYEYVGTVSSRSPALLPAFISDLRDMDDSVPADLTDWEDALARADRIIASGSDDTMSTIGIAIEKAGISMNRCWLRGHRHSVAVLSGSESNDDLVDLAEDVLLHEGQGCRSVSIVFAPEEMDVDPVLDAFAGFRGMFEAHDRTPGPLKMQQALLKAVDTPHAWADGHEFLISRGEAEPQNGCHLRWVPYDDREEAERWIAEHADQLQAVFSRINLGVDPGLVEPLGTAQRPGLKWCPDRMCHADFLST